MLQFFLSDKHPWMSSPFPWTAVFWPGWCREGLAVPLFPFPAPREEALSPENNPARLCGGQKVAAGEEQARNKSCSFSLLPTPLGLSQAFGSCHSCPFPP